MSPLLADLEMGGVMSKSSSESSDLRCRFGDSSSDSLMDRFVPEDDTLPLTLCPLPFDGELS